MIVDSLEKLDELFKDPPRNMADVYIVLPMLSRVDGGWIIHPFLANKLIELDDRRKDKDQHE